MSTGGRGGGRISSIFPFGINKIHFNDSEIQEIIKQEKDIISKIDALKTTLRDVSNKRDEALVVLQGTTNLATDMNSKGNEEFSKLLEEKNKLHVTLDELMLESNKTNALRNEVELLGFEVKPLEIEIFEAKEKMRESEQRINAQSSVTQQSLPWKSLDEVDAAIKQIDAEIDKNRDRTDLIKEFNKKKTAAEKAKKELLASSQQEDKQTKERKKHTQLKEQLTMKEDKLAANFQKQKELRAAIAASSGMSQKFNTIRQELKEVNEKMDASKAKKKEAREASYKAVNDGPKAEMNRLVDEQKRLRIERDTLTRSLEDLHKTVANKFKKEFQYKPEHRKYLIGTKGATIDTLMQDFGVFVSLDGSNSKEGNGTIFGPPEAIEECSAAIDQIITSAEESNQLEILDFDPRHSRAFIGLKGSNIARMQTASGAHIKLDGDKLTITGTREALEAAKVLISEFHDTTSTDELSFDSKIADILIGHGGATIRRIERESGAKSIRMNNRCVLEFSGHKDCVKKAKEEYQIIINNMMDNAITIPADEKIIRIVVGSQGKTIREIENDSGAVVTTISKGSAHSIVVRGTKEQVKRAKFMIEDIAFRDEIKVPFDVKYMTFLTTRPTMEVKEGVDEKEECEQTEDDKTEDAEVSGIEKEKPSAKVIVIDSEHVKKKKHIERLSPLEIIKNQCECDQISAIRSEGKIVIRGRSEAVTKARDLLNQVLANHVPVTVNIPYPTIIHSFLTKPKLNITGEKDDHTISDRNKRISPIDIIFEKYKSDLIAIDTDRTSKIITVMGAATSTTETINSIAEEVSALVSSCAFRSVTVPAARSGAVIGSRGSKIRTIQETTQCDIDLDKATETANVFSPSGDIAAVEKAIEMIVEIRDAIQ